MLTIVMYHYVRDLTRSRFPAIRGLRPEHFRGQLDYLQRHYQLLSFGDLREALAADALPPNACLLTFDDGLADHYQVVLPELARRGLSGAFFPPALPILEHRVLDVHKLHFILAAAPGTVAVKQRLLHELAALQGVPGMPPVADLQARFGSANRLLDADERFVKFVLQKGLPRHHRNAICARLFADYVTTDEAAFAAELYMTVPQLALMHSLGMEIGGHGCCHDWLATMTPEEQTAEIADTVDFLRRVTGSTPRPWTMTYPSGSYDAHTQALLRRYGCTFACTSVPALADPRQPLALDRLDTIDLPCHADAPPAAWTQALRSTGNAA